MDAKDLQFLDETFETATAFYMFMYVPMENRKEIFEEIYRVLPCTKNRRRISFVGYGHLKKRR